MDFANVGRNQPGMVCPWRIRFLACQRARRPVQHSAVKMLQHHLLLLVQEGVYSCLIDDAEVHAAAPALLLIGPGRRHADTCDEPVQLDGIQFQVLPGPTPERSQALTCPEARCAYPLDVADLAQHRPLWDALLSSGDVPIHLRSHHQDAVVAAILWRSLAQLPMAELDPDVLRLFEHQAVAVRLVSFFEQHYRHHLSLPQVAQHLGLPARTLDWHCRRAFACSPMQLFRRQRLQAAREHLLATQCSIADLAEHFGFTEASQLTRAFRRCFGKTPAEELRQIASKGRRRSARR